MFLSNEAGTLEQQTLLVVDDEQNILNAVVRLFLDHEIRILTARNGRQALDVLGQEPVAAILSDNRMPGMLGLDFLRRTKILFPDVSRVLMTAYADLNTAVSAINNCDIFRFVIKPWNDAELQTVVFEALYRHKLLQAMRSGDDAVLLSLAQTIELKDPYTHSHCERVARLSVALARQLGFSQERQNDVRRGAWLHDCGKIGIPETILNSHMRLSHDEFDLIERHPQWGAEVAQLANLPTTVINIILYHHERYDGSGYPHGLKEDEIPEEAYIVGLADVYDALVTDRPYHPRIDKSVAIGVINDLSGVHFPAHLCDGFLSLLQYDQAE